MAERDYRSGSLMRRPSGTLDRPSGSSGWATNPWAELAEMRRQMDDLMSGFFGRGFSMPGRTWLGEAAEETEPDVDVIESDGEFVVYAALPGVMPEDVHVEATDDTVRISAEYRSPWESGEHVQEEGAKPPMFRQHRQSRFSRQGSFQFSYSFPQEIRADEARASFNNGRLALHVPKVQQDSSAGRPRQIPVLTGDNQAAGGKPMTVTSGREPKMTSQEGAPKTEAGQNAPAADKQKQERKRAA
jgi:HSP20 family protein